MKLDRDPDELITRRQAAAEFGIHHETLRRWEMTRGLRRRGMPGRIMYRRGDIQALFNDLGW